MALRAWRVEDGRPVRAGSLAIGLEKHLEEWIEADPSLVADGLQMVGRQVTLSGGRLDLLAVDPQGRLVVIEVKKGALYRDALVQALDYAASIARMPGAQLRPIVEGYLAQRSAPAADQPVSNVLEGDTDEPREVAIVVVGTGRDPSLDRLVEFLGGDHSLPIRVVSFEVFDGGDGRELLIREVTEAEEPTRPEAWSVEGVLGRTSSPINREIMETIRGAAERNGLYTRPWKYSLMYTPPSMANRMLFTASFSGHEGAITMYLSAEAFSEFFPVTVEEVAAALGGEDQRQMNLDDARAFGEALDRLFVKIAGDDDQADPGVRPARATR